jgi:hypothetical protein
MGLGRIHKHKYEMKSLCTTQLKGQLMQFEVKMVHRQIISNSIHKTHHDLNWKGCHHSCPYNIFYN